MRLVKTLLLMLLPVAAFAQKAAPDSLYTFGQSRQLTGYIEQSGAQLLSSDITKLSEASFSFETANGHFRRSQQAETGNLLNVSTSGISTLGRFKLFGNFQFKRQWQDSLALTLQGVENDAEPYYFYTRKAGTYERINYNMGGIITYQLPGDHFYLTSGLEYFYNTTARSVDPRPSVQTFHMILTPGMVYKRKKQTFGINVLWGYEHEQNSVGYTNRAFVSGTLSPERNTLFSQGYGYGTFPSTTFYNMRRQNEFTGLALNYAYVDPGKFVRAILSYKSQNEDNTYQLANSVNYASIGSFYFDHYELSFLAGRTRLNNSIQAAAKFYYDHGEDYNANIGAYPRVYQYNAYSAWLSFGVQSQNRSSTNTGLAINTLIYNQHRIDKAQTHDVNIAYIQPGVEGSLYQKYANASRLKLTLEPSVRMPFGSYLDVPAQQANLFTYNIAYPDYAYYTSTVGVLNGAIEYTTPHIFKGVYSSLLLKGNYNKPITTGTVYSGATFVPSGSFLNASFSFNLYF